MAQGEHRNAALGHAVTFALHLPDFLAGKGINRHHPRAAGVDESGTAAPGTTAAW